MASTNKFLAQMNKSPKVAAGVIQKIRSVSNRAIDVSKKHFGSTR